MKCGYRIYPAWSGFAGEDPLAITSSMAQLAATQMGRRVVAVDKVGTGFDERSGWYVDFDVTYSSTASPRYEEIRR